MSEDGKRVSDSLGGAGGVAAALLRVIAERVPAMVAYWDADLRCRFANRAYERWFGVDPTTMPGMKLSELLGPIYELNRPFIERALRGEEQEFERDIPDPRGGPPRHSQALYVPDIVDGEVRGFCALVVDVTRRKRAEAALQRMERQVQATERVTAMATLAAGIAHEVNNPLGAILGNLEESLRTVSDAHARTALLDAREAALRIKGIVQTVQLLARGEPGTREPVCANDAIERSIELAWPEIAYRARLERRLAPSAIVEADRGQLVQVFVNLLLNAAQALPERDFGTNEIRVSSRQEGDRVLIEIADNGSGIPEPLLERIFEPFFTTKGVGEGMGLGLSISRSIVVSLGGTLDARSTLGDGATFTVTLPATSAMPSAPPRRRAPSEPPPRTAAARARVVVIDDDTRLARSTARLLSECEVCVFESGREAIAFLLEDRRPVDLVLCDLTMPGTTGADVHAALAEERPELLERFVVMTGGAFTAKGRAFLATARPRLLEKPFTYEELLALLPVRSSR